MENQNPQAPSNGREAALLLAWYDENARDLPWRVPPGANTAPDPYGVWLSEVMLQQTTVAAVREYYQKFLGLWPDVTSLAEAADEDVMAAWAGLGYYSRARNMLKAARFVAFERNGVFPDSEAGLLALPGVGPYTAAAIAAIAFGERAVVVDGNVERVMARYFAIDTPLPAAKPELRAAMDHLTPALRCGDFAQAVMDLGATVCKPRTPDCLACPWAEGCAARSAGTADTLPRKAPKKAKPERRAHALVVSDGRDIHLERRPAKGLLGGTMGVPLSEMVEFAAGETPPDLPVPWKTSETLRYCGEITHVFTHFRLTVKVWRSDTDKAHPLTHSMETALASVPTLMKKIIRKAQEAEDMPKLPL
ncbi:A/G-specific adenine glycosylase [Paracoccaceae bacterium GXU_MW_L88]